MKCKKATIFWLYFLKVVKWTYTVEKGEAFAQGMFIKYLTVEDEEEITKERTGGFGSTNGE